MSSANPAFSQSQSGKNSTFEQNSIPEWTKKFTVLRFEVTQKQTKNGEITAFGGVLTKRGKGLSVPRCDSYNYVDIHDNSCVAVCQVTAHTLDEFFTAVQRDDEGKQKARAKREEKTKYLNAWSICNDTGADDGERNGLLLLDFDHVENQQLLKNALSHELGILAAWKSATDGVAALIYAPDLDGGQYAAERIAEHMRAQGIRFEKFDTACKSPSLLRLESYDPDPFIAAEPHAIAPTYGEHMIMEAIPQGADILGDKPDYEAACTMITIAAICARASVRYGGHTFEGGCDVQIVCESGECKTRGRIQPLRMIADHVGARLVGGLRSTDAGMYDTLIDAAYTKEFDEKGKLTGLKKKDTPETCVCILDESGDTETSARGNGHKAQLNLIRRIACFDGSINIGATADMIKAYGRVSVPNIIPACLRQFRATTPNQLDRMDMAAMIEGGNGRRTLYAESRPREKYFDAREDLADKMRRLVPEENIFTLKMLASDLKDFFPASGEKVFEFPDRCWTARQAAKFAFERAQIPEAYADTLIYNTALWLAVLREGMAASFNRALEIDTIIKTELTPSDIYAATAIALNSFSVIRRLTARSDEARLETARTDTEKTRHLLAYIEARPGKAIVRGNLIRKFGRDILAIVENLCAEGVLRVAIHRNAEGKNPNTYFEITPEGETERAKEEYTRRNRKAQKTATGNGKTTDERCDAWKAEFDKGHSPEGANDNYLRTMGFELRNVGAAKAIYDDDPTGVEAWFCSLVTSGAYDMPGRRPYTEKDAQRLFREGRAASA